MVTLKGRIAKFEAFGPPGYGEAPVTDSKEPYEALILDTPLCVAASNDEEAETDVKKIQLVFQKSPHTSGLVGKHVVVVSKLFHQLTGHHHTAVLAIVDKVKLDLP